MRLTCRSRGGALFRRRDLRAAIIVAGLLAPVADAAALWKDKLELFVSETITHDDNVFRLSDAVDPVSAIGTSSKADTYTTTSLGLRFDVPVSRQRFLGELKWDDSHYDQFTVLNFTGHSRRAVWKWQAGNDLSGQLGYEQSRSLASLSNVQSGVQSKTPNAIEKQNTFFDAAYMLTPRWRLKGDLTNPRESNEVPEFQVNDIDINGTGLTVSYVSPAENEVGVNIRVAKARFPFPQLVAGNLVDNAYLQRNVSLFTSWKISGRSRLSAQLGPVQRNYEQFPERNFDDTTYHAVYEWQATGKLTLTADAQRDISEYEEIRTGFVFVQGVAIRPSFSLTEKINISGALEYSDRDYLGDPGLVLGTVQPRTDRLRVTALRGSYRPTRHVWFDAAMRREVRSSTDAFGGYQANIFGVTAGISF